MLTVSGDFGLSAEELRYVLKAGRPCGRPPVTMYDAEGFQAANSLNRFAIGDRDQLQFNDDGSLDLYLSTTAPARTGRPTGCRRRGGRSA